METRDSAIQQSVLRELKWDTRVDETEVGVEVDSGVVTLTGTVDSWAKRVAAQEAAHRVAGALDVANDIEVRVPGKSPLRQMKALRLMSLRSGGRSSNGKRRKKTRSMAGFTVEGEPTAVCSYDAVCDVEAEACAGTF